MEAATKGTSTTNGQPRGWAKKRRLASAVTHAQVGYRVAGNPLGCPPTKISLLSPDRNIPVDVRFSGGGCCEDFRPRGET